MVTREALQGYILEEVISWLLRNNGYRPLSYGDDPHELSVDGGTLSVRGRGAEHQVDVLGEFIYPPAFSLPTRLFIEAKYRRDSCGIETVRNAYGVVSDVNQNYVSVPGDRPRRRYQYSYALFSTKGFTEPAQHFALAHQISLVDLAGHEFRSLRGAVRDAAGIFHALQKKRSKVSLSGIRREIRKVLAADYEAADGSVPTVTESSAGLRQGATLLRTRLEQANRTELLLGFPPAPFILAFVPQDEQPISRFLDYAERFPQHAIGIRYIPKDPASTGPDSAKTDSSTLSSRWEAFPRGDPSAYRLFFSLPRQVDEWVMGADDRRRAVGIVKNEFLPAITIHRTSEGEHQIFRLVYQRDEIRKRVV